MAVFDIYKRFRNRVVGHDYMDSFEVLWAYAQYWQVAEFAMPGTIEASPQFLRDRHAQPYAWQIEQLARETVLHAGPGTPKGHTLRQWKTMAETINAMRAVEEAIHEQIVPAEKVLHGLMRISHQQFPWAGGPLTRIAARYFRIYDRPGIRALCVQRMNLELDTIFLIGMGLWGHFTRKAFITANVEVAVPNVTAAEMQAALQLFGKEFYALRALIKEAHKVDDTYEHQFNHLRAFPLVKVTRAGAPFYACPVPTLLFWRFTAGLYYDLYDEKTVFGIELGASFGEYAGETLCRALDGSQLRVIAEALYKVGREEKRTADWLVVQDATQAVFIECKTKRLTLDAKAKIVDLKAFEKDVAFLAEAVVQVYRTIGDYEGGHYPTLGFEAGRQIYPVVVTMEEWYPFGELGRRLREAVEGQLAAKGMPANLLDRMPYCVMSAAELEKAAQLWVRVGLAGFFDAYWAG